MKAIPLSTSYQRIGHMEKEVMVLQESSLTEAIQFKVQFNLV